MPQIFNAQDSTIKNSVQNFSGKPILGSGCAAINQPIEI